MPRPFVLPGEGEKPKKPYARRPQDTSAFKPERAQPPKYVNPYDFMLPDADPKQKYVPERSDTRSVMLTQKDIDWLKKHGSGVSGEGKGLYLEVRASYNGLTFFSYQRVDFDLKTRRGNRAYMEFLWKYDRTAYEAQKSWLLKARSETLKQAEKAKAEYWAAYEKYVQQLRRQARTYHVG